MANSGIFSPNDIVGLMDYQQWKSAGDLELLNTQSAAGYQNLEFENYDGYDVHLLVVNNHIFPHGSQKYGIRFYEEGVLESGTVYHEAANEGGFAGSFYDQKDTDNDYIRIDNTGSESLHQSWYAYFYNLLDSSKYSYVTYHRIMCRYTSGGSANEGGSYYQWGGGIMPQASIVDKIQVYNSAKTASGGELSLYGVRYK